MSRTTAKKPLKIYQDELKLRYTSHWDWDYMTNEELEALAERERKRREAEQREGGSDE